MQTDVVERALAEVAACRAWREKLAAERAERRRATEVAPRPLYVLKNKKPAGRPLQ